jgi:transposase
MSKTDVDVDDVDGQWLRLFRSLDEASRRRVAGHRVIELGYGGLTRVMNLTGLSHHTIKRGIAELRSGEELSTDGRVRRPGGGRKKLEEDDPKIFDALEELLNEATSGDPMRPLRWTTKSTRGLARELTKRGHKVSSSTVGRLLRDLGYSLQANKKTKEGSSHPDRDAQFEKINETVEAFQQEGQPVISIDSKKKERVGEFKNAGKTYRKQGDPHKVNVYDYPSLAIGTATPYGMFDIQRNEGMVNVGQSADTAEFAVESIHQWWRRFGRRHYPNAKGLLLCADGGGSNGSRNRSWKYFLQDFADETELEVSVCHYPPGTSKWNKIEHRMFSFISLNWQGQPLVDYETIVNLIGSTRTEAGLKVRARLDPYVYERGIKITDDEMAELAWSADEILPHWNYTISPRATK